MPTVDIVIQSPQATSSRARATEAMFDVPTSNISSLAWKFEAPLEKRDWKIGLICGPSGSGKTTIAKSLFPNESLVGSSFAWTGDCVMDDFDEKLPIKDITDACSSVGFNTIPAWLRPFHVLSNGEQFRVTLARALVEGGDTVVFDEFTSVVDRQVAKIASHAVQKYIRRSPTRRFVAVTCHEDIEDWLQPDWVIRPDRQSFDWRSVRSRPTIECEIAAIDISAWNIFKKYHYLTSELHKCARCFALWLDGRPVVFGGFLPRPTPKTPTATVMGLSRIVTLPDYQGLGLAFVFMDYMGSVWKRAGLRMRTYLAHPPLIRSFQRSKVWRQDGSAVFKNRNLSSTEMIGYFGGRPNASFEYVGPAAEVEETVNLLAAFPNGFWESSLAFKVAK